MSTPKYNRTFHLPWSEGATNDDKIAKSIDSLLNRPIVITEKVDGSNVSLETAGCFARSHVAAPTHPSFDGLKAFHASIKHIIPDDIQLFGEWVYALHSIAYDKLPSYFLMFAVRSLDTNTFASWEEVERFAGIIGVPTVPVLASGVWKTEDELRKTTITLTTEPSLFGTTREGIVVRVATSFANDEFPLSVMKSVRAGHVGSTDEHWKHKSITKNGLRK